MLAWLNAYWTYIAFAMTVAVLPFGRWVVGTIRKGLASHDDIQALKASVTEKLSEQGKAAAAANAALEQRVGERLDKLSLWVADHNVMHAQLQGQLDAMPRAEQVAQVLLQLKDLQMEMREAQAATRGELQAVGANVDAIQRSIEQLDGRVSRHEGIFADAARPAAGRRVPA